MTDEANIPNISQLTYGAYLKIPDLLSLQQLQSQPEQHDETLFIIIHQVYELWFKQVLHEVGAMVRFIDANESLAFIKSLKRVTCILDVLVHQVDILETMTPIEFDRFRSLLNPASGFQSHQFRVAEFTLGIRDQRYLKLHQHDEVAFTALSEAMAKPSLWDSVLAYFYRRGIPIPQDVLDFPCDQKRPVSQDLAKIIAGIYRRLDHRYNAYTIVEALLDLDQKLLLWRYRHVAMVERIIGITRGTGGTAGVEYLSKTLQKRAFPEIWEARQYIITQLYGSAQS
jgi:tryptophan 2,3-dioxygenase